MKKLLTLLFVLFIGFTFAQTYKAEQKVLIKWNDDWFPGKIVEVRNDGYYISYDNYDETWNEVVGTDRLKNADGTTPQVTPAKTPAAQAPAKVVVNPTPAKAANTTEPKTFEAKVKAVCDCFEEAKKDKSKKMSCFKLQGQYAGDYEDEETKKFLSQTNLCAD